ncbi:ribonuclease [Colletotrichum graminicola]|uniref:Ribonuclease n=1 Tax=Colletotrichum graminicola (strain M1.001 / M2 / FGSC 10212) TaxID=645133 RepID=E3QJ24_COLGM|nr:ribonuclease [Colletotrichum graminicola M1.001]EFQ30862.1 ribonuclease [Colletotrichum graminicola M1.001]WDK21640.1 ribonuclease [Colletotrichum graminicola]
MVCLKPAFLFSLCAIFAVADPVLDSDLALEKRQGVISIGDAVCGDNSYSRQQIEEATAEGCRLYFAGKQVGSSEYPHRFNNRENLVLATAGPYQEFPIIPSGNYTGRSPGPDRVILDPNYRGNCVNAGIMTHTGATDRNGFIACNSTGSSSGPNGSSAGSTLSASASLGAAVCILSMLALTA